MVRLPGVALAILLSMALVAAPGFAADLQKLSPAPAPALRLADASGVQHDLAQYRGKVVVINFWATWCAPCREEMPSLDRLQKRLATRPFVLLTVDVGEDESRVQRFLDSLGLRFNVLYDRDGATARAWRARALPATFVLDTEGLVRYQLVGATAWDRGRAFDAITALLPVRGSESAGTKPAPPLSLLLDTLRIPNARQPG
jgi:thiol-disulfide isomerase/thioredoxin